MYEHNKRNKAADAKPVWMMAIRDSAYGNDHVPLRYPVRWRLLRRVWIIPKEIPGEFGRWIPF